MDAYERDSADEVIMTWGGDDGDGLGLLTVRATSKGFGGVGHAWVDRTAILEFADRLTPFPLDAAVTIKDEYVKITVRPVRNRGQLGVYVHLASEPWPDDRPEGQHEVRLELLTTYQRLVTFSRDLRQVVDGSLQEAVIGGERLS